MEDRELIEKVKNILLTRECSLDYLVKQFDTTEIVMMGLIRKLREEGENINVVKKKDGIYFEDYGDQIVNSHNTKTIVNNEREVKILLISDTRLNSKFEQLSILNNIYKNAYDMGVRTVLHMGDITEGVYFGKQKLYNQTLINYDTDAQAEYIRKNYPYLNGMTTYFITGEHDLSFLKTKDKEDIGLNIGNQREDLIYLGQRNCMIYLQDGDGHKPITIDMRHTGGTIPYTISYKPQQIVDNLRPEERPDIINFGHFLVHDTFRHQGVLVNQVPSIVATTPEMIDKGIPNVIGATILTITLDKKNRITKVDRMLMNYKTTIDEDYRTFKVLNEKVLRKGL